MVRAQVASLAFTAILVLYAVLLWRRVHDHA